MQEAEALKLIRVMMDLYPNFHPTSPAETAVTWATVLYDIPYDQASRALMAYVRVDKSGFAPTPGQLMDVIKPPQENSLTAWGRVEKALRNSQYNSELEFAQLPDDIKRAVGGAGQLKAWAMLDRRDIEIVAKSHFIKAYNLEAERIIKTNVPESMRIEQKETETIQMKTVAPADLIEKAKNHTGERKGQSIEEMYAADVKEIMERARALGVEV